MQAIFSFARTLGLSLLLGGASLAALAGDGHDHGEAPAAPSGPAMPRFAATSDLFELVGVLDGAQLSLYLDHSADNRPVADAQLELDLGGKPLALTRVAEGEFRATLAAPPPQGETPVTATVVAGDESDLLAATLDVHATDAHTDPAAPPWRRAWAWGAGAAAAVLALGWALRRARTATPAKAGGAA